MDKTFINIGNVIKTTDWARSKYHPLLTKRNLAKKGKTSSTLYNYIATHEIHVDIDNNVVTTKVADAVPDQFDVIKYALSSADSTIKYLIGNAVLKKESERKSNGVSKKNGMVDLFLFDTFESFFFKSKIPSQRYDKILTSDSFIYKYRILLEANIQQFIDIASLYIDNDLIKEIALIVTITYNGVTDAAHTFTDCLNEIDEMFLQTAYVKDKGYIFTGAFYSMFNYGKYVTRGVQTMCNDSMPHYNKEDFLSLYYAKNVYNETSYNIDRKAGYSVSIFPDYDGLTMEEIEKLLFKRKNLFDFNLMCTEIETIIARRTERNRKEKIMIPLMLKFDVYYRYELGKAGKQNMLRLSGVRYSQLIKIKKHFDKSYKLVFGDRKIPDNFLYAILFGIYKDNNNSSDRYITTIFKTFQNIYQQNYVVPQQAEYCLLDKSQFVARKGDDKAFRKAWNDLFNTYKFLKTMENQNFISELTNNKSYQLGVELAKFESGWKKGRENLKKTIEQFTGNVSKRVYCVQDVFEYYTDLVERLTRNRAFYGEHNELLAQLNSDIEFDKNEFIMGYFTEKNTFSKKVEETVEEKN